MAYGAIYGATSINIDILRDKILRNILSEKSSVWKIQINFKMFAEVFLSFTSNICSTIVELEISDICNKIQIKNF